MGAPNYQASDFLSALKTLLPQGKAWPRSPDAVMTQVMAGLVQSFARHTAANNNLLVDAFPSTAVQMLPEWETALGLPDPCAGEAPTLQGRQLQVVARLTNSGGQSIPYFVAYAKALGYDVTTTEFAPFRVNQSRVGDAVYSPDWAYTWTINAPLESYAQFRVNQSSVGEALASWGNKVLECELAEIAPAHTILRFTYS